MELVYYFYYHGEDEFEKRMFQIFEDNDYEAFMKIYKDEGDERLPEHAVLYIGDNFYFNLPIDNKDVFNSLTYVDSEWG